jgi:hypothetical protein
VYCASSQESSPEMVEAADFADTLPISSTAKHLQETLRVTFHFIKENPLPPHLPSREFDVSQYNVQEFLNISTNFKLH